MQHFARHSLAFALVKGLKRLKVLHVTGAPIRGLRRSSERSTPVLWVAL